jgi:hypothetical protein
VLTTVVGACVHLIAAAGAGMCAQLVPHSIIFVKGQHGASRCMARSQPCMKPVSTARATRVQPLRDERSVVSLLRAMQLQHKCR